MYEGQKEGSKGYMKEGRKSAVIAWCGGKAAPPIIIK
jgi:hypothetical protein